MENVSEIDLPTVKSRAVKGVLALSGRTFILQIVSFLGFFFLTVLLKREEFGLFFAVSELVAILGYFSDIGLAAALIQKKETPDEKDVRSTFTIQQILVVSLLLIVLLLTPSLKNFYNIPDNGIWLLRALMVGFFLASLKTIPSVLLERKLRFDLLAIVEIFEAIVFYGIAVILAWKGFGINSYTVAILIRGIVGVVIVYLFSPWPVGFAFERQSLKHLLKFGIPYQANSFLAVIKDRMMNVILWKIIGVDGVGILGWAQKWAQLPLRFVMDPVMKVTFPAYSRIQEDKNELKKAIEKTIFFVSLLIMPMLAGMLILSGKIIHLIPQYGKWEVALLALYFYLFNSTWGAITTPLTNVLAATGRIRTVFKLMIMWTFLTWILFPLFGIQFGYNGVAFASALVAISSSVAIYMVNKIVGFNVIAPIRYPLLATIIMSGGLWLILFLIPSLSLSIPGLGTLILFGILLYFFALFVFIGQTLINDAKNLILNIRK
jgi:O-antigen/teichoic acid export membrane protein